MYYKNYKIYKNERIFVPKLEFRAMALGLR